jgi:hypothetical protein
MDFHSGDPVSVAEADARNYEAVVKDAARKAANSYRHAAELLGMGWEDAKEWLLAAAKNYVIAEDYVNAISVYLDIREPNKARRLVPLALKKENQEVNENAYLEMRLDAGSVKSISKISMALRAFVKTKPRTEEEKQAITTLRQAFREREVARVFHIPEGRILVTR